MDIHARTLHPRKATETEVGKLNDKCTFSWPQINLYRTYYLLSAFCNISS